MPPLVPPQQHKHPRAALRHHVLAACADEPQGVVHDDLVDSLALQRVEYTLHDLDAVAVPDGLVVDGPVERVQDALVWGRGGG